MSQLKAALQALAAQAKANKIHKMAEMQVQANYVVKVLELLGWKDSDMKMGAAQGTNTGNFPDIRLHDRNKHTVLVVECKDAKKADKLDGRYGNKTFVEQLYGYCRAEGINWGILTNFIEWRLYNDVQGRLYKEKKYAFIDLLWPGANPKSYVDILSDEGLAFLMKFQRTPLCQAKGRVDDDPLYYPVEKQVEDIKAKFFVKLKGWRDSLRRELHKNYGEKYEKDQIDLFTQKILDRMIFIDVCYDKGIIGQNVHSAILSSRVSKYHELKNWFKEMDEQFNTELFSPMAIDHFDIDDKVMVPIIEELSGIDFKNVSVHIIGEVYENYLGEMLRVTKKSGLKVQEHKEQAKRKSQGIYYTPEYIVDYIVKNTVGELVKKAKTEDDLKQIKILDPACGSGSFLIKAFDMMYEAYEKLKIEKNRGQLETGKDLKIKRLILQHNLYGVDLDDRAVEITKLNLMLKALEGFNYHELKGRKLLPNLNLNIRVGNSLISGQTIEQLAEKQTAPTFPGLDDTININPLLKLHNAFYKEVEDEEKARLIKEIEEEERRLDRKLSVNLKGYFSNLDDIKPLNYQVAFPEVSKQGGFDAVIGNPPWGQKGAEFTKQETNYLKNNYKSLKGIIDIFRPFIEKNISLLTKEGLFGLVLPDILLLKNYPDTRKYILDNLAISDINVWGMAFADVNMDSITLVGVKKKTDGKNNINVFVYNKNSEGGFKNHIQQKDFNQNVGYKFNLYLSKDKKSILDKLCSHSKYSDLFETHEGIHSGNVREKLFVEKAENEYSKKLICGRDEVQRYKLTWAGKYVNYSKNSIDKVKGEYANLGHTYYFENPKLVIRRTGDYIVANIDRDNYYFSNNVFVCLSVTKKSEALEYILGILNSELITWYYRTIQPRTGKLFAEIKINLIENIPVRRIDFKNRHDKFAHDQIVKLVREILKYNKIQGQRPHNTAEIAAINKDIDELVYKLYGINEKEKTIIQEDKNA